MPQFDQIITNWRTSACGALLIGLAAFVAITGIHIPGFTMDAGAAFAAGFGLLLAKDSNVTGGTIRQ